MAAAYINYLAPGILIMTVGSGCETTAMNLVHGHERRHHHPLPHHGDRPHLGADRPGAWQPDPDDDQRQSSSSGSRCSWASGPPRIRSPGSRRSASSRSSPSASPGWGCVFGLVGKTPAGANSLALIFHSAGLHQQRVCPPGLDGRPGCAGSPSTSPSRRSSIRYAGCCWARPSAPSVLLAIGWCVGLTALGYLWARAVYTRGA